MGAAPCEDRQPGACQGGQAAEAAAMKGFEYFSYSAEQWASIAASVAEIRGVDDAHRIGRGGAGLRNLIEVEAGVYCAEGLIKRQGAGRQARIDQREPLPDGLRNRLGPPP